MATPMIRAEDVEESALAAVDREFTEYFGPHLHTWQPWQVEQYLDAVAKIHAAFQADSYQEAA